VHIAEWQLTYPSGLPADAWRGAGFGIPKCDTRHNVLVTAVTACSALATHISNSKQGCEGTMFTTYSYQEVLSERAESSNLVMSAWFMLLAIAVFMVTVA
jgi:hypothetical protein